MELPANPKARKAIADQQAGRTRLHLLNALNEK